MISIAISDYYAITTAISKYCQQMGGYEAQSKCHIGISPSGPKKGLWDQSQCHVHAVIGIDPNVIKNKALGSVPKSCTCCKWD